MKLLLKNQAGITLIEILVGLAIVGVLGTGMTTAMIQIFNHNDSTNARITAIKQVETAIHHINRDVQMANHPTTGENESFPLSLSWKSWTVNDSQTLDTYYVTYSITNGNLIREYWKNDEDTETTIISHNINENPEFTCWSYNSDTHTMTVRITSTVTHGSKTVSESRLISIVPRPGT